MDFGTTRENVKRVFTRVRNAVLPPPRARLASSVFGTTTERAKAAPLRVRHAALPPPRAPLACPVSGRTIPELAKPVPANLITIWSATSA